MTATKDLRAVQLTVDLTEAEEVVYGFRSVVIGEDRLRAMQELVTTDADLADGKRNLIEYAPCDTGRGIELVIDEEGLYHAPVIRNAPAMQLWAEVGDLGCISAGSLLCGNVLVVGAVTSGGDPTDAPAWVFERFGLEVPA